MVILLGQGFARFREPVDGGSVPAEPLRVSPLRAAVLLSGSGRTLQNLLDLSDPARGEGCLPVDVRLVVSSSARAYGLERARAAGVRAEVVGWRRGVEAATAAAFALCREAQVELVCLAGFLKLLRPIPADFRGKVLNIHPALIPAFCGKGYYGSRVHQAVWEAGVRVTGCTVHLVDDEYDHGPIVVQRSVELTGDEGPDEIAARVFEAECQAYPEAIRRFARGLTVEGRRVRLAD